MWTRTTWPSSACEASSTRWLPTSVATFGDRSACCKLRNGTTQNPNPVQGSFRNTRPGERRRRLGIEDGVFDACADPVECAFLTPAEGVGCERELFVTEVVVDDASGVLV